MVRVKSKVDSTAFFALLGGQFAPNSGGQFTPNSGGQFRPEQVVSLNRIEVVSYTEFSSKDDTLAYEFELIHRTSSEKAVVQVKNGNVDLNRDVYRKIEANVFLFTTQGKYVGEEASHIKCLTTCELDDFLIEYQQLLPRKIKFWMNSIMNKE